MSCEIYQKLLYEYIDGTLPTGMRASVDEHLQSCDVCRRMVEQEKRFTTSVSEMLTSSTGALALDSVVHANVVAAMDKTEKLPFYHDMMELFEEITFREKVQKVVNGLKQPKDSGKYKYAKLQLIRLSAPVSAVVVPIICFALLMAVAVSGPPPARIVNVRVMEPEPVKELDKTPEIEEPPPEQEINVDFTADVAVPDISSPPSPAMDFSPQPALLDSVMMIKSPVIMKGIFGSRSPGARGSALVKYGGNPFTEDAVLRALRWLKKYQEENGSWRGESGSDGAELGQYSKGFVPAMTGMGLLTFLAHGETSTSKEFGLTVEKAIKWLVDNQQKGGRWQDEQDEKKGKVGYVHAIATYAMCEAYGLTKISLLKAAAEKGIDHIIGGQNPMGGWRYTLTPADPSDTSVMGWHAQALKAAKIAGLKNDGLEQAIKKAVEGFKRNTNPSGAFGYCEPQDVRLGGLTGGGVLSLQLLGAGQDKEARQGLLYLQNATFDWAKPWGGINPIYYWYYVTQAKFHAGGETWHEWNKQFAPQLIKNQKIIKEGIMGPFGKKVDIGYWQSAAESEYCQSYVYNTALCALMLQVYYRYLPTFQPLEQINLDDEPASDGDGDIKIKVKI